MARGAAHCTISAAHHTPCRDWATPFFVVHGREASLPHDAFVQNERHIDLHDGDIEHRIEMMALASRVVDQAYEVRRERIAKRNENVLRTMHYDVGDFVMVRQPPQRKGGRS
jgi:hypothetical protein